MMSLRIHNIHNENSFSGQGSLKSLRGTHRRAKTSTSILTSSPSSLRIGICKIASKTSKKSESRGDIEIKITLPEVSVQNNSPKRTPKKINSSLIKTEPKRINRSESQARKSRLIIPLEMRRLNFDIISSPDKYTTNS